MATVIVGCFAMALVQFHRFVRGDHMESREFLQVDQIANALLAHLNAPAALSAIELANLPGASSSAIQAVFEEFARELGFENEKQGLFSEYELSLRPDYFCPVGESGILLEVERGKTTINNMDLLDFWKCHLCEKAHYLFLVVPASLRQNDSMRPRNEFATVCRRLSRFFVPRNYTNVRGAFIYGY